MSRLLITLCIYLSIMMVMWEWTDRNVEYVCEKISGHEVEVLGIWTLLAAHTGPVAFVFNIGTEIYAATSSQAPQK